MEPLAALQRNSPVVPIVTSIDHDFVPIFSVLLASLIDSSRSGYFYDIVILTERVSKGEIRILSEQLRNARNFALRAVEMDSFEVPNLDKTAFKRPAFFRLVLPELLINYPKVLYLDADMVVVDDLAGLFQTDVENVYAAVVRDEVQRAYAENGVEEDYLYGHRTIRAYWTRHLGLNEKSQDTYFNSGLMILNLEKIRKDGIPSAIPGILRARPYVFADQDILNLAFAGNVALLDQRWNLFHVLNPKLTYRKEMLEARDRALMCPGIIHYAWKKPWNEPLQPMTEYFWLYARKSAYYEQLIARSGLFNPSQPQARNRSLGRLARKMLAHIGRRFFPGLMEKLKAALRSRTAE